MTTLLIALGMGLLGAVTFSAIGLASGTDETATKARLTLLVVFVGVPPVGVLAVFLAAVVAKHVTHAIPTLTMRDQLSQSAATTRAYDARGPISG